jgi:hypothetical protein
LSEKSEKKKTPSEDDDERGPTAEEIKEFFSAVSTEVPTLIKSIINAVFSEEAGRNMGKAAAAFYKELKDSGMPDNVAVKMTEDYIGVFTSLGDLLKSQGKGIHISGEKGKEFGEQIEKRIKEKLAERRKEECEEEED